jgi:hypothetical protein
MLYRSGQITEILEIDYLSTHLASSETPRPEMELNPARRSVTRGFFALSAVPLEMTVPPAPRRMGILAAD